MTKHHTDATLVNFQSPTLADLVCDQARCGNVVIVHWMRHPRHAAKRHFQPSASISIRLMRQRVFTSGFKSSICKRPSAYLRRGPVGCQNSVMSCSRVSTKKKDNRVFLNYRITLARPLEVAIAGLFLAVSACAGFVAAATL